MKNVLENQIKLLHITTLALPIHLYTATILI